MIEPIHQPSRSEGIARRVLIVAVLLLMVVLAGTYIKVPYAVEKPGPVTDTLGQLDDGSELVAVKGTKSYPTSGALYFTTVRILGGPERHITAWEWVTGHLDPDSRVVPEEEVFGRESSAQEVEKMNAALMQGSQENSIAVGMRSGGVKVAQRNLVDRIGKGMPAEGVLETQDVITSIDGTRTERVSDIVTAISDRDPGDAVRIGVRRDGGQQMSLSVKTEDIGDGRAGIGIGIEPTYDFPYEVRIDAGSVGGPSAGMMFALAVYDRITPGPLTGGESIAGTGTIDDAAQVGPIGGIAQKMVGAKTGGATWFLAPEGNCEAVVGHVPDGLRVVPVGTFEQARTSVESIAKGDEDGLPTCEERLEARN